MRRWPLWCLLLVVAACARPAGSGPGVPESGGADIAMARVPSGASYVVRFDGVRAGLEGGRELLELLAVAAGGSVAELDEMLRRALGVSPLLPEDLADLGIDTAATAVVFSEDVMPTFALPVADGEVLEDWLRRNRPPRIGVSRHRGHDLYWWRPYGDDPKRIYLSWARVDDWFLLHTGIPSFEANGGQARAKEAWFDGALDGGFAESERYRAMVTTARRHALPEQDGWPDLVGIADTERMFRVLTPVLPKRIAPCVRHVASRFRPVVVVGDRGERDRLLTVVFPVAPRSAATLRTALDSHARVPTLFADRREQAGLYAAVSLGLAVVHDAIRSTRCPGVEELVAASEQFGGSRWSAYLAASEVNMNSGSGDGIGFLALRDRVALERLRRLVSLVDREAVVAGQSVRQIAVPGAPVLFYHLRGGGARVATSEELMAMLLDSPDVGPAELSTAGHTLLDLALRPARLSVGDLLHAVDLLAASEARRVEEHLRSYERLSLELRLLESAVVFRVAATRGGTSSR